MLRVPNFFQNFTLGCGIHKTLHCWVRKFTKQKYTTGYAIFIHKDLLSKISEAACGSMMALQINYNLGAPF